MATEQIIWCREDKAVAGPHGQTYKTTNDANAAIKRIVQHTGGGPGDQGKKTYDVVAVTVP
jgi:hypothetical protein